MNDINQKRNKRIENLKKLSFIIILALLVTSSIYGLFVVSKFLGYAVGAHSGSAGNVYMLLLQHRRGVSEWAGLYGVSVRVPGYTNQQSEFIKGGDMNDLNLLFDCLEPDIEHEIYATTANPAQVAFTMLYPVTAAEVDAWMGKDVNDYDSATNTFTEMVSFNFGSTIINTIGTHSRQLNVFNSTIFTTAVVKDASGNMITVAVLTNFTEGFNGRVYNYQMLLPVPDIDGADYYFYTDPNDQCPQGDNGDTWRGFVIGNVTDTVGSRIENVIIDVAGTTGLSDATGFYNISPYAGNYFIYAIKSGFQTYKNNITVIGQNITVHDIVMVPVQVPNPFTGVGSGVDAAGQGSASSTAAASSDLTDVGPGEYEMPPSPYFEQPKEIEGKDYLITLNDLKRKIRLDSFIQEQIYVFSFKQEPIVVTFEVTGDAADIIQFESDQINLEPNSNAAVVFTIFGKGAPGKTYTGNLTIDGDINATVPIEIEILTKDKLSVEALQINLETAKKDLLPNEELKFKTDLRNLMIDQPYPVNLFFTIQPADGGDIIWTHEANVNLKTAFSLIRSMTIPSDAEAGDYVLRVTASYLGLTSATSTIFRINVPFWQRVFLGLRYWHWLLILLAIVAIAGAAYAIHRNIESKKKFHIKVDMKELPKPGPRSIYVGKIAETDHKTYFNLESFKVHTIVAGSTGGGKSVSAQVIIEEALEKNVAVIVFDPTAQWTGMLRACKDKMMLGLYPLFGMKKTDARAYPGNIRMILDAREKIDIFKYVKPGEIQVFCFHKLDPKDMDIVVANAIRTIFRSGPKENKLLKIMFVFDEVHRLLPKFGGSGDGFLQIERACREFRKWGMGIMLISQVLSDFVGTIKANINTEIQMRTRDEGDLERIRQKYGEGVLRSLVKATVGSGMVENPAYNRGQPYFVAFKPLKHSVERMTDEEIQNYNDYNDKVDNLYYSLDQLEEQGIDVFDLKLELKLAQDKVKAGNFNMVDVYLEGLKPRIDKQWEKIGKQPKQLVRELVDLAEMKADLDKAKEERDKYEAEHKKEGDDSNEKKEMGWTDDVKPDKILSLANGMIVINMSNLYDEIVAMKDDDLIKEFNPEPEEGQQPINKFATWVMDAIGDTKFAYALAAAKTKDELVKVLDTKKSGGDFGDVKPPAWFVKPAAAQDAPAQPAKQNASTQQAAAPDQNADQISANPIEAEKKVIDELSKPVDEKLVNEKSIDETSVGESVEKPQSVPEQSTSEQAEQPTQTSPVSEPQTNESQSSTPESVAQETTPVSQSATEQPQVHQPDSQATIADEKKVIEELEKPVESSVQKDPQPEAIQESQVQPPSPEPVHNSIDDLMVGDEQAFKLENGMVIKGIKELREYLPNMDDAIFNNHVGDGYNHFADWISGVFNDQDLKEKVKNAHTKDELIKALS